MISEDTFDIVIVGGGHNGITAAAYLAKCGLSVCVLEERPEVGGAQENAEPMAGVRIDPCATYLYGALAPGFEQLELWKYGFRMAWNPMVFLLRDESARRAGGGNLTTEGVVPLTEKDIQGWNTLCGLGTKYPFLKDLLRAVYWCPPHPAEVEVTEQNIPYMQVLREKAPEVYSDNIPNMTMFDLMDEFLETESNKTMQGFLAWYSGAAPHWEGMAIPALAGALSFSVVSGLSAPRGGMHNYAHSIVRCALAYGARVLTCCPVEEIVVQNGRAQGVRLRDDAARASKFVWARKAVLSDVPVQATFLKLIGPEHTDVSFRQRIKDISLKGGSIYVTHFLFREPPRFRPKFAAARGGVPADNIAYPVDSREVLLQHMADVDSRKSTPNLDPDKLMWIAVGAKMNDFTNVTVPGYLVSPFYIMVPPPEYHVGGPDAVNKVKEQMNAAAIRGYSQVAENIDSDNIIGFWANSPYDSELRNTGLIAGNWYSTRHCSDQWAERRPLPELARYRTPIDGLYLCHQTSHPGGLCLMAVPYNLMHILIEDGIAQPGAWWYPSPYYIPESGKISAVPTSR